MTNFKSIPFNAYFCCKPAKNVFVKIAPRNILIEGRMKLANAFDLTANRLVNVDDTKTVSQVYVSLSAIEGVDKI